MTDPAPLRVGLAGAGPWARFVHAPMLANGPETVLTGVWSRTAERAGELAATHGATHFTSLDALLEASDAVACCVAPDAQVPLAVRAAEAGKALLLEKPLGLDQRGADAVADAVRANGVGALVLLTYRFAAPVRQFLADAAGFGAAGGRACFLSGAFLGGPFAASPWRQEHGALLDVGPHVLDLADAALGPIEHISAAASPLGWVGVRTEHVGGAVCDISLCCRAAGESRTEITLHGPHGVLALDGRADDREETFATVRREFATIARAPGPHPADAERGRRVQAIVDAARRAVTSGRREAVRSGPA